MNITMAGQEQQSGVKSVSPGKIQAIVHNMIGINMSRYDIIKITREGRKRLEELLADEAKYGELTFRDHEAAAERQILTLYSKPNFSAGLSVNHFIDMVPDSGVGIEVRLEMIEAIQRLHDEDFLRAVLPEDQYILPEDNI